jgi:hypothetical protein
MSNTILILGESGTGKSSSIRNLPSSETFIINVNDKRLPFRNNDGQYTKGENGSGNYIATDDPHKIIKILKYINEKRPDIKNIIIDKYILIPNKKGYLIFEIAFFIRICHVINLRYIKQSLWIIK